MAAKNESHGLTANLTKDAPSDRVRDTREGAQDDSSTECDNNPPNHGKVTNYPPAMFMERVGEQRDRIDGFDPEIGELADLYQDWREDDEQTTLEGWSE